MKKVRITAMKRAIHEDLIEKYENPIEHACDTEIGKVFIANGYKKPEGLCNSAWESMAPFVMALYSIRNGSMNRILADIQPSSSVHQCSQ